MRRQPEDVAAIIVILRAAQLAGVFDTLTTPYHGTRVQASRRVTAERRPDAIMVRPYS